MSQVVGNATETTQPVPFPADGEPSEARPVLPSALSLWQFYLVCVASFCLYLPFWIWRTAKQFGLGTRYGSTPVWWALGSVAAPVAAAVLYEFNRRVRATPGRRGRAAWPALAYLALILAWALTPLANYVVTFPLLMPIPFLFVQRNINRAAHVRADLAHPPRRLRLALALALAIGLPMHAATAWFYDLPAVNTELLSHRLAGGTVVSGSSDLYELTLPNSDWRRVPAGTFADADSDLELVGPGSATSAAVFTLPTTGSSLELEVSFRRDLVFQYGSIRSYDERRYFLGGSEDLIPVSFAIYDSSPQMGASVRQLVLTAELEDQIVLVIGVSAEPDRYSQQLSELVLSFAVKAGEEVQ